MPKFSESATELDLVATISQQVVQYLLKQVHTNEIQLSKFVRSIVIKNLIQYNIDLQERTIKHS